jgi:hypothetical protein
MILKRDESETDSVCHKGESPQKAAIQSPNKFYIPLEHYTRITENLCLSLSKLRSEVHTLKEMNYVWKWFALIAFGVGIMIGYARW